jgi:hypothetical protein
MNKIRLKLGSDDSNVGYVFLPDHPGDGSFGVTKKQLRLRDLVSDYVGLDVYLDFDKDNRLIGIELVD